jgi:hypothetical protein
MPGFFDKYRTERISENNHAGTLRRKRSSVLPASWIVFCNRCELGRRQGTSCPLRLDNVLIVLLTIAGFRSVEAYSVAPVFTLACQERGFHRLNTHQFGEPLLDVELRPLPVKKTT